MGGKSLIERMFGSNKDFMTLGVDDGLPSKSKHQSNGKSKKIVGAIKNIGKAIGSTTKKGLKVSGRMVDNFGDWAGNRQAVVDMQNFNLGQDVGFQFQQQKPKSTVTQRVEAAKLNKKASKLAKSLGISHNDALDYLRTYPNQNHQSQNQQKQKHTQKFQQKQESDEQRIAREKKRYFEIITKEPNINRSYAWRMVEQERNKKR